jgi:hypothetical protein
MSVMPLTLTVEDGTGAAGKCVLLWREGADLRESPGFLRLLLWD